MSGFVVLIVLATSIWVYFDAKAIGIKKGQLKGIADMSPGGWFAVTLFLWIIGFPLYLSKRGDFKRLNQVGAISDKRKCPYCAEEIQWEAVKCKHCGSDIQQTAQVDATPVKKKRSPIVVYGGGSLLFLVLLAFMAAIFGTAPDSTRPGSPSSGISIPGITTETYEIRVNGTNGTRFSGSYMQVGLDGSSNSQTVEGSVPATYEARGNMVSVAFQKKTESGQLSVEIVRNGSVVKSSETTAAYGMVTVATR
jgi:hypothetical protein